MQTIIEKQADGYEVRVDGGQLIIGIAGKGKSCHVSHFCEWGKLSREARAHWGDRIPEANRAGLFASPYASVLFRVRPIGDAVAQVLEIQREASEQKQIADAKRDAEFAERDARQAAIDAPLLEAMRIDEARLVAQIPAGAIRCTYTEHSDGDGGTYCTFFAEGVRIPDPVRVGWASAVRPGAQGAFESVPVFYATRDQIRAIKSAEGKQASEKSAAAAEKQAARDQAFAQARATGERQPLKKWTTNQCMNHNDSECSFDSACRWAMPDGTESTTYTCCH